MVSTRKSGRPLLIAILSTQAIAGCAPGLNGSADRCKLPKPKQCNTRGFDWSNSVLVFTSKTAASGGWNGTASNNNNLWKITGAGSGSYTYTAVMQNFGGVANANATGGATISPDGTKVAFNSLHASSSAWNGAGNAAPNIFVLPSSYANAGTDLAFGTYAFPGQTAGGPNPLHPAFNISSTKVAWHSSAMVNNGPAYAPNTGNNTARNIWVMNADGTSRAPLTFNTTLGTRSSVYPVFNPKTGDIVFASQMGGTTTTSAWDQAISSSVNLWAIDAAGTTLTPITKNYSVASADSGSNTGFSMLPFEVDPSGTYVYYSSTMNLATTGSNWNLTANLADNIWVSRVSGAGDPIPLTRSTSSAAQTNWGPSVHPKGEWIAFISTMPQNGNDDGAATQENIWMMRGDGTCKQPLTNFTASQVATNGSYPHFTPDGGRIYFSSRMGINSAGTGPDPTTSTSSDNLWIMDANGENPTPLTKNTAAGYDVFNSRVPHMYLPSLGGCQ